MIICQEMRKLRKYLDDNNIEWVDVSVSPSVKQMYFLKKCGFENKYCDTTIFRTHFTVDNKHYSVIYGYGTLGGVDVCNNTDEQLLEVMIDNNEPTGFHTAEDVIEMIIGGEIK